MMLRVATRHFCLLLIGILLASCGSNDVRDGGPESGSTSIRDLPGDAVPRPEPRSRYGNGPVYEVFGKRYVVMNSSSGFKERGVASWYGKKFHNKMTSMQERYDMYAMTAAHKTLPLPSYVRVRNLSNNKSVVVRVNDRGPFVDNRIIDLSYSAALKLDIVRDGTSLVEIEAVGFDGPSGDRPVRRPTSPRSPAPPPTTANTNKVFVQVGAFSSRENANRLLGELKSGGIGRAFVIKNTSSNATLYRVRIGPIKGVVQYDILVEELENLGISDPYLITE
jgi:rare lipoprotein A